GGGFYWAELYLSVGPDAENGNGRFGDAEDDLVFGGGAFPWRGAPQQRRPQLLLGAFGRVGPPGAPHARGGPRRARERVSGAAAAMWESFLLQSKTRIWVAARRGQRCYSVQQRLCSQAQRRAC